MPQPFELAGVRKRIDQIVRSTISEPPAIEVYTIPTDDDPSLGYLVVHVPASSRAPHMVTVGKEHRYYGRGATGNVLLTEGEVAPLYKRRQRWEVDYVSRLCNRRQRLETDVVGLWLGRSRVRAIGPAARL